MLTIRGAFHLTHMVKDLDAATRVYQAVFRPPIRHDGYSPGENRDAAFATISDLHVELFAPRDADAPNPASTAGRFIRRSGEGLANFGWFIEDDVPAAIGFCRSRGYDLVGVQLTAPAGPPPTYFFIHPRQAQGIMLEIAGAVVETKYLPEDPRRRAGWAAYWRDEQPLGIERLNAVTYAVRDLDAAIGFLQSLADVPVVHRAIDAAAGSESAFLWCADHLIEVRHGLADSTETGRFIGEFGPRIHSTTFKVQDLGRAAGHLTEQRLAVTWSPDGRSFTLDPAAIFGARYAFTDRAVPNDPRDASGPR